jgi:hypothetical protein
MSSKAYRATDVNQIDIAKWLEGRPETLVHGIPFVYPSYSQLG